MLWTPALLFSVSCPFADLDPHLDFKPFCTIVELRIESVAFKPHQPLPMGSKGTGVLEMSSYSFFQKGYQMNLSVRKWLQHRNLKEGAEYKAIQLFLLMSNSKETTLILFGGKSSLREGRSEWKDLGADGKDGRKGRRWLCVMGDRLLQENVKDGCSRKRNYVSNSSVCYREAILRAGSCLGWNAWDRILNRKIPSAILCGILRLGFIAE